MELAYRREELYAKIAEAAGKIDPDEARRNYEIALKELEENKRSNKANETLKEKEIDLKAILEKKKIDKAVARK